jgi:hypothetical protein
MLIGQWSMAGKKQPEGWPRHDDLASNDPQARCTLEMRNSSHPILLPQVSDKDVAGPHADPESR